MQTTILDAISFAPDLEGLCRALHLDPQGEHAKRVRELAAEAAAVARPKAAYREAYVEARGDDYVVVEGRRLTSRVLRINLEHAHRVFPWLATCGREVEAWSQSLGDDLLERYWAGAIMEAAVHSAARELKAHLKAHFGLGRIATMNPGSLEDWPLSEQAPLFALLGDASHHVGVELSDSFLMTPIKSVSGLHFPAEVSFENCQLCLRPNCPGRRARYDKDLYERKYRQ